MDFNGEGKCVFLLQFALTRKQKNCFFSAEEKLSDCSDSNFTSKENFHLTLVFIGETEKEDEIKGVLSNINFSEFKIKFSETGCFENGIFWVGIKNSEPLTKLQSEIFSKLENIGLKIEKREFIPHITLARKFSPNENFSASKIETIISEKEFTVNKISLVVSKQLDGKTRYTEIFSKEPKKRSGA